MRETALISIGLILFGSLPLSAQLPLDAQTRRDARRAAIPAQQAAQTPEQAAQIQERNERMLRAEEERRVRMITANAAQTDRMIREAAERDRQRELARSAAIPKPKPAVVNVDVRAVFSRIEYKTFGEAQANAVDRIADGEPLWLYVKFRGKLGDYVFAEPISDEPGRFRYMLFTEIGPQGDVTALTRYVLRFDPSELTATELKINLAPGIFGPVRSIPVWLKTADSARPGVWHNEFRISNSPTVPRGTNEFVAKSAVILDLSGSHTKYRQMWADYDSIMLRGTPDPLKIPIAGSFYDHAVKKEVEAKLKASAIVPAKFYFSGNDWGQVAVSAFVLQDPTYSARRERRVFATYTYQKFGSCLYGVAEVIQAYDETALKFLTSSIDLANDFPLQCGQLK